MFLLILKLPSLFFCILWKFTFHYVSTYTPPPDGFDAPEPHLHSTMFLLILLKVLLEPPAAVIYIPLCFYLYGQESYRNDCVWWIYIPLCFYLYLIVSQREVDRNTFTFHYVSTYTCRRYLSPAGWHCIYIPLCFYLYRTRSEYWLPWTVFTFHYVSTYTLTKSLNHLKTLIYIPLCFYLYN